MNPPSIKKTAYARERLAQAINQYSEEHHISLRKLSRQMNLSDSYLQKVCSMNRFPSHSSLIRICRFIGLPLTELDQDYVVFSPTHRKAFDIIASLSEDRVAYYLSIIEITEQTMKKD